jgi:Family of unknown function (DUF6064)
MYVLFLVHPVEHQPLDIFLTTVFGRGNATIWPMQLVWYAIAVAMVGLALWPVRRASQIICVLAAAYLAWIGIVFFGVVDSGGVGLAWLWAVVFILEAILFLVAGLVRRDLVFAPRFDRWDLASILGAILIGYSLVGYPIVGLLVGHPLSTLPLFGLEFQRQHAFGREGAQQHLHALLWVHCARAPLFRAMRSLRSHRLLPLNSSSCLSAS